MRYTESNGRKFPWLVVEYTLAYEKSDGTTIINSKLDFTPFIFR